MLVIMIKITVIISLGTIQNYHVCFSRSVWHHQQYLKKNRNGKLKIFRQKFYMKIFRVIALVADSIIVYS